MQHEASARELDEVRARLQRADEDVDRAAQEHIQLEV
jgi:hypothetical protein